MTLTSFCLAFFGSYFLGIYCKMIGIPDTVAFWFWVLYLTGLVILAFKHGYDSGKGP